MTLEEEFTAALRGTVEVARERKYNPAYFLKMLAQYGGLETAKRLIAKRDNLARAVNAGSPSGAVGMAMLPALGLDGLTALGGSFTFNRGQFEVVGQAYLLLDVPRAGVLELIALQPTETEPEPWAFEDVASYATFTWDAERTYHKLRSIVDSFVGEGTFRRQTVENVLQETDVDFEADVLPQLDGRASFLVWIEEPLRFESRSQLFGIHLKDGKSLRRC